MPMKKKNSDDWRGIMGIWNLRKINDETRMTVRVRD